MNARHRSNADFDEGTPPRDTEAERRRLAQDTAADRADETVEEETERAFDEAEELPREDSA